MAEAQALTTQPTVTGVSGQLGQLFGERMLRQLGLIAGLGLSVALGIWLFTWAKDPLYRPVYGQLSEQDAAAVADALQAAGIDYRLDGGTGGILVPADKVHDARLKLAAQGLPQGSSVGFELLQKEQGFGTSQFMENARFQRALETELARTVMSMQGVESARVHLAIPKQSVFIRERSAPSASVLVNLFPGRSLNDSQVASIIHMVASSVPELSEEKVTVVDQRGQLLTRKEDGVLGATSQQLEYKQQIEDGYVRRIEALLTPMFGAQRVRAQVNARLNFAHEESTQELFDPDSAVVRSEQTNERRSLDAEQAQGVPGALTNQPPQAGTLAPGEGEPAVDARTKDLDVSSTRNFEISKTVRHTRRPTGTIERLSVAVLVDQKETADADGNTVREPLTQAELDQIAGLVREAVGFDENRGDSINVISAAFQAQEEIEPIETSFFDQPRVWEAGKWLLAFIAGMVLLQVVVRPILRGLLGPRVEARAEPPAGGGPGVPQLEGREEYPQLTGPDAGPSAQQRQAQLSTASYEDNLALARQVVSQEPAVAASVVKNWLSQDE